MIDGRDKCLDEQLKIFKRIIYKNKKLVFLLKLIDDLDIANCYVGAGCINQTIFNYYHGYDIDYGINDYDIVYYDNDLSYEGEDKIIKMITSKVNDDIKLDIKNQARVHLWYYDKYGIKRKPYVSVEDAIGSWGATITCVGVRIKDGRFYVYAPYGLNDIFNMVIRPVKYNSNKVFYEERCNKWKNKWYKLKIVSWEGDINESINNRG